MLREQIIILFPTVFIYKKMDTKNAYKKYLNIKIVFDNLSGAPIHFYIFPNIPRLLRTVIEGRRVRAPLFWLDAKATSRPDDLLHFLQERNDYVRRLQTRTPSRPSEIGR